jgi:hypothetical protein
MGQQRLHPDPGVRFLFLRRGLPRSLQPLSRVTAAGRSRSPAAATTAGMGCGGSVPAHKGGGPTVETRGAKGDTSSGTAWRSPGRRESGGVAGAGGAWGASGGDSRKGAAVAIQAVYRGFRVRRKLGQFVATAQQLGHGRRPKNGGGAAATMDSSLPGAPMGSNGGGGGASAGAGSGDWVAEQRHRSQRIREWVATTEAGGGSPDKTGLAGGEEERGAAAPPTLHKRRSHPPAMVHPPPPAAATVDGGATGADDAMSVSSMGSQDPRTWISSRQSRRHRRRERRSAREAAARDKGQQVSAISCNAVSPPRREI